MCSNQLDRCLNTRRLVAKVDQGIEHRESFFSSLLVRCSTLFLHEHFTLSLFFLILPVHPQNIANDLKNVAPEDIANDLPKQRTEVRRLITCIRTAVVHMVEAYQELQV